jgi:molecular chaperone DnaJ
VFGDTVDVPTISGEKAAFSIPAGTQPGTRFRLSKMGLPIFNNSSTIYDKGDQIVQVRLEVPLSVSGKHEKVLRELVDLEKENVSPQRKAFFEKTGDGNGTT